MWTTFGPVLYSPVHGVWLSATPGPNQVRLMAITKGTVANRWRGRRRIPPEMDLGLRELVVIRIGSANGAYGPGESYTLTVNRLP